MMTDPLRCRETQLKLTMPHGRGVSIKNARGFKPDRA
jgi:hypothetical protein